MKRTLSFLLALIIALSAFSMAAFAADAPKSKTEALFDKLYTATELQVTFTQPANNDPDVICQGQGSCN